MIRLSSSMNGGFWVGHDLIAARTPGAVTSSPSRHTFAAATAGANVVLRDSVSEKFLVPPRRGFSDLPPTLRLPPSVRPLVSCFLLAGTITTPAIGIARHPSFANFE